ncbi:hypothetical protein OG216_08590 [Streptomycetaceae bacterium NBC_01309]
MPPTTATPEPPDPDARLDVPVTVWLAPHPHDHSRTAQPASDAGAFALPSWVLARLADVYATPGRALGRLRLWRPPTTGPLAPPRWTDATAGIVVDLTATSPLGDARAVAVLDTAAETLAFGAYLFAVTAYDPDTAEETCGPIVRAAQALGLAYVQHLIAVNGHADGDRIIPYPGDAPPPTHTTAHADRAVPGPAHVPVHTDLLVFRTPGSDAPSGVGR